MGRVGRSEDRPQALKCWAKKYRLYSIGSREPLKVDKRRMTCIFNT